jgi:hypothetical protein
MSPRGIRITKFVVVASAIAFLGLFALFVYDARRVNAYVSGLRSFEPGTPFAEVVARYGEPDRIDPVSESWRWGRRMVRVPPQVKRIAVYSKAIAPQVCTFSLDDEGKIYAIEVFATY